MVQAVFEQTRPDDYLLRLAASDFGRAYKRLALSELDISSGDTLVDLGCGPGTDLPEFANATGPKGTVVGLDHDRANIERAAARTSAMPRVTVRRCDIHALDLAASGVDRAHTDRVLQHVADPSRCLAEALRVLRPGGRAVFAEPDWETLTVDYPDISVARTYTSFITDCVVRNGCIGRQLPRLATAVGFKIERVIPITTVFRDATTADKALGFHRVTKRAVAAGYLSDGAAQRWLNHLATRPFFASATLFIVVATKPSTGG